MGAEGVLLRRRCRVQGWTPFLVFNCETECPRLAEVQFLLSLLIKHYPGQCFSRKSFFSYLTTSTPFPLSSHAQLCSTCASNQYVKTGCTAKADTVCTTCTTCAADEDVAVPCSSTIDTVRLSHTMQSGPASWLHLTSPPKTSTPPLFVSRSALRRISAFEPL